MHWFGNDLLQAAWETSIRFLTLGVFFFIIEKVKPTEPKTSFFKKELGAETAFYFTNALLVAPALWVLLTDLSSSVITPLIPYQAFDKTIQSWPLFIQVIVGLIMLDATVYWRHRFTHACLWRFHAVHHSAQEISWLTKTRLHPVDVATAILFQVSVLHVVGFKGLGITLSVLLLQSIDYFAHANLDFGFKGPMRFILSTPRYHRWHHADSKEAYNKNFVVAFPFIDLAFGTYHYPVDRLPEKYGLQPHEQAICPHNFLGLLAFPFFSRGSKKQPTNIEQSP